MIDPETVFAFISREAGVERSRLVPEATLDDLSITSLDVINILFAVEDKCGTEFDPAEFEGVKTVREFTDVIFSKAGAGATSKS